MPRPLLSRAPTKSCAAWTSCCGDYGKRAGARVPGGIRTDVDRGVVPPKSLVIVTIAAVDLAVTDLTMPREDSF
jgi:hypothetical protein